MGSNKFSKRAHYENSLQMRNFFDIDALDNSQNDRVWAVDRADADKKGGIKQRQKFPQKVMVWLGSCFKGTTPLVNFDEGTVDHTVYIKKVLPVALKYGNETFGRDWIFQQDGARPDSHHLTQQRCRGNFPSFLDNDCCPPNSPDLNRLNYSIWNKLVNPINWNKVKSKTTLIQQLKSSFKNVRESVVLESCLVAPFDCIACLKVKEIIYVNKNKTIL